MKEQINEPHVRRDVQSINHKRRKMKHHDYITGYKATDKDMKCQGFQYELGKWYKIEGEIELCKKGFHFCIHPSGPWSYYNDVGTRVFKVEAKDAIEEYTPGADLKIVCREIRLTEELHHTGDRNTGNGNATDYSSGFFLPEETACYVV